MQYDFHILDVFSPTAFGGNQLAVLPNAQGITPAGMQKIAREFNFAESTFVLPPEDPSATARVRIFTPNAEVDFAGHPTVGTACAIAYAQQPTPSDVVLQENVGPVPVRIERHNEVLRGTLISTTPLQYPAEKPTANALASVLSIDEDDVIDGFFASVGLEFCFAHLSSREAVDRAVVDRQAWQEHLAEAWSSNVFCFAGSLDDGGEIYARMSAPAHGIDEDPATGSAAAALMAVAGQHSGLADGKVSLTVHQGVAMGRASTMAASAVLRGGKIAAVEVGGPAVLVASGKIEVADPWLEAGSTA